MPIEYIWVFEEDSNSKFVEFYITHPTKAFDLACALATSYDQAIHGQISARLKSGDSFIYNSATAIFTRKIYIYSEADLNPNQLAHL